MPVLGLPLTYEQNTNAEIVRQKNIGTVLDYREVDGETIEGAIKHLLGDKTVTENVKKLSSLVTDTRTQPLEVSSTAWCDPLVIPALI